MKLKEAYTLIEMVMVIVVVAILAVTAYIKINSYQTAHLRSAAERLAADIRYAKGQAVASSKWHGISFQVQPANTYILYETDGSTDTNLKLPHLPSQDYIIYLNIDYQGVNLAGASPNNQVEFNPYGVPYDDKNGSAMATEEVVNLSGGGSSVAVRIAPATGRIYVQ